MSDLHDMSTTDGTFRQFCFRWKNAIWTTLVGGTILLGLSYLLYKYGPFREMPESEFVLSGSKLMYYGNKTKFEERHFDPFPGLPNVSEPVDTIEIKWVRIDGPNLTSALSNYYPSLKTLHLNNVTLEGLMEPVKMDSIEEFYLNQGLEPEERYAPKYTLGEITKAPEWIHSTLFFLNDNSSDFETKAATVYKRGINVTVFLKGSIAYMLNPKADEVRLDVSPCAGILDKLPKTYKFVTLGYCNDLRPDSISPSVTQVAFYIVSITSTVLSEILRRLPNLEEFYAEIPSDNNNVEIDLNLTDFSDTIRVISFSSMNLSPTNKSLPSVKEFYFGAENQYSWVPSRVTNLHDGLYRNFGNIFPNIERVGLFDLIDENRYEFLNNVLQTKSVKWLLAVNFARNLNYTETDNQDFPALVKSVENTLSQLGLNKDANDFIIKTGPSGTRTVEYVSKMDKLWFRYKYLGWSPIDSWPKYLYVQKIIENGGIL